MMAYTEIKERNGRKYVYRVISLRKGMKVAKKRIYLGINVSAKELRKKEEEADSKLNAVLKTKKAETLERLKKGIIEVLKRHKIKKASIFGSYARGEQKKGSDIDVIIEPTQKMGLFEFTRINFEIEDKLGKKVDLLTYNSIYPLIKKYVKKDEMKIL